MMLGWKVGKSGELMLTEGDVLHVKVLKLARAVDHM
jgi:hypothetical protein